MAWADVVFGNRSETTIRKTPRSNGRVVNKVLLGTFLHVLEKHDPWLKVETRNADHFAGLIHLLKDPNFTFGTIFHNGIIRYDDDDLPDGAEFDLGNLMIKTTSGRKHRVLTSSFDDLDAADRLIGKGHLMATFKKFWQAAVDARRDGRLNGAKRVTSRTPTLSGFGGNAATGLRIEVYGPVPTSSSGLVQYVGFPETEDIGA